MTKVLAVASFESSHQFEVWQRFKRSIDGEAVEIHSISFEYVEYTPRVRFIINVVYWRK